jgi:hypothetical protein
MSTSAYRDTIRHRLLVSTSSSSHGHRLTEKNVCSVVSTACYVQDFPREKGLFVDFPREKGLVNDP